MFTHQLSEMTQALIDKGLITPEQQQDAQDALAAYWDDRIAITWTVEDVIAIKPGLSEEQAAHVLNVALHNHDASRGINWDTLANDADYLFGTASES